MIKKFNEHKSSYQTVNFSDLKHSWSAEYKVNKEQGYLPFEVISGQYVVVPEDKLSTYKMKSVKWLKSDMVGELNKRKDTLDNLVSEYEEYLKSIEK